jgi:HSP20 family protein
MFDPRREWIRTLDDMQRQMEQFLEHVIAHKQPVALLVSEVWQPRLDVYEMDGDIVVLVELAGVNQEDVQIIVNRTTLTVQGDRKHFGLAGNRIYHQIEVNSGPFRRSFDLPSGVDADRAQARFEMGFLQIVLPKSEACRAQRVDVTTG